MCFNKLLPGLLFLAALYPSRLSGQEQGAGRPELLIQNGHDSNLYAVCFSPKGNLLATGGMGNVVKLWDTASWRLVANLAGHSAGIEGLQYSPDGTLLASASGDGTVRLWRADTGSPVRTLAAFKSGVKAVAFNPAGTLLAVGGIDSELKVWNARTFEPSGAMPAGTGWTNTVAFSPDGALLAAGGRDGVVRLWDSRSLTLLRKLEGHTDQVNSLVFCADGRLLVSGSSDNTVRLWSPADGRCTATLQGHGASVESVVAAKDGRTLYSAGNDRTIRCWDLPGGRELSRLAAIAYGPECLALSPDGARLAHVEFRAVRIWDLRSGAAVATLTGRSRSVTGLSFSPDGGVLAAGSHEAINLWDPRTARRTAALREGLRPATNTLRFTPDGRRLLLGCGGGCQGRDSQNLQVWDTAAWKVEKTLAGHPCYVDHVAISPDGRRAATAGRSANSVIRVWDLDSGARLAESPVYAYGVASLAFSPAGRSVLFTDASILKEWEYGQGTVRPYTEAKAWMGVMATDGRGLRLAFADKSEAIHLIDLAAGRLERTLRAGDRRIHRLAFSPDGSRLALSHDDNTVRLVDAFSGTQLFVLSGHTAGFLDVAFSPDGRTLASGGWDSTVRLWDTATGACKVTLLALDAADWVVWSDDGYFDCSPGAARYVTFKVGMQVYGLDQYEAVYRRPDLIARRLGGQVSEFMAAKLKRQQEAPAEFVLPPMLAILEPEEGAAVSQETVQVKLMAVDPKHPVGSLMIKVNGRPIPGSSERGVAVARKGLRVTQSYPVKLQPGENLISAAAYNEKGIRSDFAEVKVSYRMAGSGRSLFLLALAVDEYPQAPGGPTAAGRGI